jgi:predicted nucleic acid-binding protein
LTRIIVDASVILAGLFKEGTVRDLLLNLEGVQLLAPSYLVDEVDRHLDEVISRTQKPEPTVRAVLQDVLATLDLVAAEVYSGSMGKAQLISRRAGAEGDSDYVAMALHFSAPIWTLDRDFRRVAGIKTLSTSDVERIEDL